MSYSKASEKIGEYRKKRMFSLMGKERSSWFMDAWGDVKSMLTTFVSDEENSAIVEKYASAHNDQKAGDHIKLDYVCGMRREVRKQYVSGDSGIYTDVTPFRYGMTSANGANMFDMALNTVLKGGEEK